MNKKAIQLNELNKLYDEFYYSNLDDVEYSLDIITNLMSEREYIEEDETVCDLSGIIHTIIEILDEVADIIDNEGINNAFHLVKEKIDKIQSGELDDIIEIEYQEYSEGIDTEELEVDDFDEGSEPLDENDELYEEEDFFDDNYDE